MVEGTFFFFSLGFRGLIFSDSASSLLQTGLPQPHIHLSFNFGFSGLIFIDSASYPLASASTASSSVTSSSSPSSKHCLHIHQENVAFTSVKRTSSSSKIIFIFEQLLQRRLQRNILHLTQLHNSDSAIIHQESPNDQQHMTRLVKERLHLLHQKGTSRIMKVIKISLTSSMPQKSGG